jgi:hypothetical protein
VLNLVLVALQTRLQVLENRAWLVARSGVIDSSDLRKYIITGLLQNEVQKKPG